MVLIYFLFYFYTPLFYRTINVTCLHCDPIVKFLIYNTLELDRRLRLDVLTLRLLCLYSPIYPLISYYLAYWFIGTRIKSIIYPHSLYRTINVNCLHCDPIVKLLIYNTLELDRRLRLNVLTLRFLFLYSPMYPLIS